MSKKLEFIKRVSEPGAKLAEVCREFDISRQTGHKWRKRYLELGADGLEEQSRRPKTSPLSFAEELVAAVLEARDTHPSWGPKKIHLLLQRRFGERTPSRSTVARMLKRFGRVLERRRRPALSLVERPPSVCAEHPNDVWTVDFKGWWRSQDGQRCEPLTVRDARSRFVFAVTLTRPTIEAVKTVFESLFRKYGLPAAIQCDNGCPFIEVRARAGFTRLSAWWVSLGIRIQRSRVGCPQDNGGHERMHRDIAGEVETSPAKTPAAQQHVLDKWRQDFNHVRPHDALEGKTPAEAYRRSERRYRGPLQPVYPGHFAARRVMLNGWMKLNGDKAFVGKSFAGQIVGLEQLDEIRWRVWFFQVDCGVIELLPNWLDDLVPHPPTPTTEPSPRHDARRRTRSKATAIRRPSSTKTREPNHRATL